MEVDPRDHRNKEEKIASISPWKRKHPETRGGNALFMGSGTIIDCENVNGTYFSTVLTSASFLRSSAELEAVHEDIKIDVYISDGKLFEGRVFAYDFHFNIAFIKIESNATLPTASLRLLEDSISIDPNDIPGRPHSNVSKLCPGDIVVAVGRFFDAPYNLMAARGQFSLDCCKFDCKELFRANRKISKCGIGGPLINHYGEVIGVNFYDSLCTPFLPVNIVSKCLEHFKKYGNFCRPWLGMEMTNLYAASVDKLERIIQKFPNIVKGVLVEKFYGIIWDKVGKSVEVVVIRERSGALLNLTMVVDETSADKFNRWPLPKRSMQPVGKIQFG
ncbi:hypothetical protein ACSBR1_020291 [Camellia fascicularis]